MQGSYNGIFFLESPSTAHFYAFSQFFLDFIHLTTVKGLLLIVLYSLVRVTLKFSPLCNFFRTNISSGDSFIHFPFHSGNTSFSKLKELLFSGEIFSTKSAFFRSPFLRLLMFSGKKSFRRPEASFGYFSVLLYLRGFTQKRTEHIF